MNLPILPPATLGVIGGGQLGRMFVQAAQRMGYRTIVLSPTADSPAAQVRPRGDRLPARCPSGAAADRRSGRRGHRRVRERLVSGPQVAGTPSPGPSRLADGPCQPESPARKGLPCSMWIATRPMAAGAK